ncbi:hypothetical protein [Streptomyces albogriseolus]|uniref:hypothetical protein n=1 Tax=Streptomyces albogriseolus TaxID=1887 RepID=UPI00345FFE70
MNESDLRELEDGLRSIIRSAGLAWLLDELDATIAAGVAEEKLLRRRSRSIADGPEGYETIMVAEESPDAYRRSIQRGATLVVTTRPMTSRERAELFLEALRRLLLELPRIEDEALKIMADSGSQERVPIRSVRFAPDESLSGRRDQGRELSRRLTEEEHDGLKDFFKRVKESIGR